MATQRLAGRNLVLLVGLGALWGTAFMFISLGLPSFPPVLFAALRFDLAGVVVLGFALARRADLRPRTTAQWVAILVAAVLNVGAYHAFLFWGQRFTTAAVAAVIVGLNPVVTTVISRWLLEDERVGWHGALGLLLGMAGIVALATLRPGCPDAIEDPAAALRCLMDARGIGELAVVAAIVSWAMGSILVRRTRHRMDVFAFTAWQMLAGAALLHLVSFAAEPQRVRWDLPGVVSLLYLAIVSSAFGFILYFTLLERVGPIRSNLVSHVAPVFAALAGLLVLGEPFEARALVAFALIASGFLLVARPASSRGG